MFVTPASPALSIICGQGQEFTQEWSSFQVLHSGRLQSLQTRLAKDNSTVLLRTFVNYGPKKVDIRARLAQCYKTFFVRNLQMFVIS